MILKRFMIVSLVVALCAMSDGARASDSLELSSDNVTRIWRNINEVIMVLSANIAMDDEWIDELRNLQPAPSGGTVDELALFLTKLNTLLASSDLQPVADAPDDSTATTSALYMRSGVMLDNLIYYFIQSDALASVAIYYGGEEIHDASDADVLAQINLANQRLDAYIEENGL